MLPRERRSLGTSKAGIFDMDMRQDLRCKMQGAIAVTLILSGSVWLTPLCPAGHLPHSSADRLEATISATVNAAGRARGPPLANLPTCGGDARQGRGGGRACSGAGDFSPPKPADLKINTPPPSTSLNQQNSIPYQVHQSGMRGDKPNLPLKAVTAPSKCKDRSGACRFREPQP
jgi:hypothetical protein